MTSLWLIGGVLIGLVNGFTRWWTVARLRPGREQSALLVTSGGLVLRLALAAALLMTGLRSGLLPGLTAFAGLWLARLAFVIWAHNSGTLWRQLDR